MLMVLIVVELAACRARRTVKNEQRDYAARCVIALGEQEENPWSEFFDAGKISTNTTNNQSRKKKEGRCQLWRRPRNF